MFPVSLLRSSILSFIYYTLQYPSFGNHSSKFFLCVQINLLHLMLIFRFFSSHFLSLFLTTSLSPTLSLFFVRTLILLFHLFLNLCFSTTFTASVSQFLTLSLSYYLHFLISLHLNPWLSFPSVF